MHFKGRFNKAAYEAVNGQTARSTLMCHASLSSECWSLQKSNNNQRDHFVGRQTSKASCSEAGVAAQRDPLEVWGDSNLHKEMLNHDEAKLFALGTVWNQNDWQCWLFLRTTIICQKVWFILRILIFDLVVWFSDSWESKFQLFFVVIQFGSRLPSPISFELVHRQIMQWNTKIIWVVWSTNMLFTTCLNLNLLFVSKAFILAACCVTNHSFQFQSHTHCMAS